MRQMGRMRQIGLAWLGLASMMVTARADVDWSNLNIVFEGDSLTAWGQQPSLVNNVSVQFEALQPAATVTNVAEAGQRTEHIEAEASGEVDPLLHGSKVNVLVCLMGTNDWNIGRTAAATYEDFEDFWQARVSAGWDVCICVTLPDASIVSEATNFRADYNSMIAAGYAGLGLHLLDLAADSRFSNHANTTYYWNDGVHLMDAATAAFASLVEDAIETALTPPPSLPSASITGTLTTPVLQLVGP